MYREIAGTIIKVTKVETEQATSVDETEMSVVLQDNKGDEQTLLVPKESFDSLFPKGIDSAIGQKLTANGCCDKCQNQPTCYHCYSVNTGGDVLLIHLVPRTKCQHTERIPICYGFP